MRFINPGPAIFGGITKTHLREYKLNNIKGYRS